MIMRSCGLRLAEASAPTVRSASRFSVQCLYQGSPRFLARYPPRNHASTLSNTQDTHNGVLQDVYNLFDRDPEYGILRSLQARYPDFTVTISHESANLLAFAKAGEAEAALDMEGQNLLAWLKFEPPKMDEKTNGEFQDLVYLGRYLYHWKHKSFIMYSYCREPRYEDPGDRTYFILYPKQHDQIVEGRSTAARELVQAAATHTNEVREGDVLVFDDGYWRKSTELWKSVQRSKWENLILDEKMKAILIRDVQGFFDQEHDYKQFEVPYKRGGSTNEAQV